jgi:hypothetical protein
LLSYITALLNVNEIGKIGIIFRIWPIKLAYPRHFLSLINDPDKLNVAVYIYMFKDSFVLMLVGHIKNYVNRSKTFMIIFMFDI